MNPAPEQLSRNRLYLAPVAEVMAAFHPATALLQRLEAYAPALRIRGRLIDTVQIPDIVIQDNMQVVVISDM